MWIAGMLQIIELISIILRLGRQPDSIRDSTTVSWHCMGGKTVEPIYARGSGGGAALRGLSGDCQTPAAPATSLTDSLLQSDALRDLW